MKKAIIATIIGMIIFGYTLSAIKGTAAAKDTVNQVNTKRAQLEMIAGTRG